MKKSYFNTFFFNYKIKEYNKGKREKNIVCFESIPIPKDVERKKIFFKFELFLYLIKKYKKLKNQNDMT